MTTLSTKLSEVNIHAIVAQTIGTTINGMIKIGFKTIGVPKMTGSLMLNKDGTIHVFPKELAYLDLARNAIKIASPIVHPEPPIQINHWKNGSAAIAVGA